MSAFPERRRYELLLGAILLSILVFPTLAREGLDAAWLAVVVFSVLLIAALNAAGGARKAQAVVFLTGIGAFVSAWMSVLVEMDGLPYVRHALTAAFFGGVTVTVLRRVLAPGRVTGERVTAAICVYLLLGLLWASAYSLLLTWAPGAIRFPEGADGHAVTYFSFVTLTTLGYGEITPVHPLARSLAFLQAATGVLYVAVLVARLVALQIVHAADEDDQRSSS